MAHQQTSLLKALERWLGGGPVELPDNVEVTPSGGLRVEIDEATRDAARVRARRHYGLRESPGRASASDPESEEGTAASVL